MLRKLLFFAAAQAALALSAQQPFPGDSSRSLLYGDPYLQHVTPTEASVMFQSTCNVQSWVEYGTDTLQLDYARQLVGGQEAVHDAEHRVRLTGLQPGATYYYRVGVREITQNKAYHKEFGREETTPFHRFTLPADTTTHFTALVFNDMHSVKAVEQAMGSLADRIPHDFVVFNGDCLPEPADRAEALAAIHSLVRTFHGADVPCVFVRGNHEIRNAYSSGMLSLFDYGPGATTYHAFSWGDTRFVISDCGEDKPDNTRVYYGLNDFSEFRREQAVFLAREASGRAFRKARRRVLIHHIPLWYSKEKKDASSVSGACRALWSPALSKMAFDISVNAHTHEFEMYEKGQYGNFYPMIIGGGPSLDTATVTVIEKRGKVFRVKVLNVKGEVLWERMM